MAIPHPDAAPDREKQRPNPHHEAYSMAVTVEALLEENVGKVQQLYEVLGGPGSELSREQLGDYAVAYGNAGRRLSAQVLDQIMPFRRMVYV